MSYDQDTRDSTDRAWAVDALAGVARVLAELAGVGQHGGGGEAGGAATYTVIKKILSWDIYKYKFYLLRIGIESI